MSVSTTYIHVLAHIKQQQQVIYNQFQPALVKDKNFLICMKLSVQNYDVHLDAFGCTKRE